MKAADIPREDVLAAIRSCMTPIGASRWNIYPLLPFPEKVVNAKINKMIRQGILRGCTCGCRGDFTIIGE